MKVRLILLCIACLMPLKALARGWGEEWGTFLWGTENAPPAAIPVDGFWMIVVLTTLMVLIGALKLRAKPLK